MGLIAWIVVGLIAGALGKLIMPGDDPGGGVPDILPVHPFKRASCKVTWSACRFSGPPRGLGARSAAL